MKAQFTSLLQQDVAVSAESIKPKCKNHLELPIGDSEPDESHFTEEKARQWFMRLPQVLNTLQISRAKFLKMVKDGHAPQPAHCGRCSLYVAEEVYEFAQKIINERNKV